MKNILIISIFVFQSVCYSQIGENRYSTVSSQSEFGIYGGGTSYLGDLNQYNPFREINIAVGLVYRYNLNTRFALRANATFIRINASDSKSNNRLLKNRNLDFRNDIYEIAFGGEINFFKYRQYKYKRKRQRVYTKRTFASTPYLFLQVAYFYHNPTGTYKGKYIDLRDLGTEGQSEKGENSPYFRHQISFPFGIGYKFNIAEGVSISIEWVIRLTATDYLDDVSGNYADVNQIIKNNGEIAGFMSDKSISKNGPFGRNTGLNRGTGSSIDWYQTFGAMISFRLGKGKKCYN